LLRHGPLRRGLLERHHLARAHRATVDRHHASSGSFVHTALVCRNPSSACGERSRPQPDCLYPPNGAASSNSLKQLIQTTPALIFFAIACAFATSRVQIAAASPYIVPFATDTASASSATRMHASTGPKISSCAIFIFDSTSANTVGFMKWP